MNDTDSRPPRSLVVVLLDGVLRLVAAVHSGATPTPKVREAGGRRGVGRYLLVAGVVAALAGTALLVVMLVRAPDGGTPPPDRAAALPGLASRTAQPSVAVTMTPGALGTTATPSSARSGPATATTRPAPSVSAKVPITENAPVPLTASYRTSSVTAGLLGYRMAVTVDNPGTSAKDGWTVTVTLPRSTLRVSGVSGATAAQDGSVWTFTPDAATSRVPAGGSVELAFEVQGATLIDATPQDCRIDGNRCGD
ncbi:cellulose binding domain-containing protein [Actinoplanes sp. CA-051413]|uniref:cellulose binding domain-containing protein n=1 Tax=Actinoplanes sp. CA-051413 TaxID=3239899 RepID=UPI003D99C25E